MKVNQRHLFSNAVWAAWEPLFLNTRLKESGESFAKTANSPFARPGEQSRLRVALMGWSALSLAAGGSSSLLD